PEGRLATTLEQSLAAAAAIGYPVVLKAQSPDLSHKSDAGGVVIGLVDATSLTEGWVKLHADIARHRPGLTLDGVLIEAMGKRGIELIIGARNDPDWGPVILAGFGGITAEILGDVRILTPDLPDDAIIRELHRLKNAPLLRGFRGSPPLDVNAAARIIATLGQLLLAEPAIREIDLNPVVIYPDGEGAVALDALMLAAAEPTHA
ncbi:acetate--CoA ligase family protein, partial [Rhizobium sp. LEGMi12c]